MIVESNDVLKLKFKKLHPTLVKSGLPAIVIDFLFQKDVISDEELRTLQKFKDDPQQRGRELLALLHTSGNQQAFVQLYQAIKQESAFKWLVEEIDTFTDKTLVDLLQQQLYINEPTGQQSLCYEIKENVHWDEKRQ